MLENSIKEGKKTAKLLKNKGKMFLSDVRKMEDEIIVDRLESLGVHIEKASLSESIKKFPSSEEYYIWLMNTKKLKLKGIDEDMLWMGLTVLWERWFPDIPNFEMLDDKIYSGYRLLEIKKIEEACNIWWDAWNDIIYLMNQHNISGINAFDNKFRGTQSVFNWASDFEMELHNAGIYDASYAQKRIDFCSEYIKRSEDKQQLNVQNMKISIAESYIRLGRQNEGDALFERYLKDDPEWGWGWIGWSDCYWIFHGNEHNDNEKAEAILKKALSVKGLRDREDVLARLLNFYSDNDRNEEADAIERELSELEKNKSFVRDNIQQAASTKVGRNQPCHCGSGKKYKKCCGK